MAILRGFDCATSVQLAEAAYAVGIRCVEVPIQSDEALRALGHLVEVFSGRDCVVGAGTVTSVQHVEQAARAGAAFTVAPGLDPEVFAESTRAGLGHLPGVATATEIQAAHRLGATWIKAFPATVLGVDWFRAMRGPFPELKLVATGGVAAHNAADLLAAGADAVAVGAALADPAALPTIGALGNGEACQR